jgi:hypothetical protein
MFNGLNFASLDAMPAKSLKARGRCCKNACAHCPFGFTMKKFGLKFIDMDDKKIEQVQTKFKLNLDLDNHSIDKYKIVTLKDFVCALIRVDKLFVREFYLLDDFQDQGITKEVIESYYFY